MYVSANSAHLLFHNAHLLDDTQNGIVWVVLQEDSGNATQNRVDAEIQ
jgi:hypothetical protein